MEERRGAEGKCRIKEEKHIELQKKEEG